MKISYVPSKDELILLDGIWKGMGITEEEIRKAREYFLKSLRRNGNAV